MLSAKVDQDRIKKVGALLADGAGDDLGTTQLEAGPSLGKVQQPTQLLVLFFDFLESVDFGLQLQVADTKRRCLLLDRAQAQQRSPGAGHTFGNAGSAQLSRRGNLRGKARQRAQ